MNKETLKSIAEPVRIVNFYDIKLTVVEFEKEHYVSLKPIVEMLGLSWRHSRKTILTGENTALFGTKQLNPAPLDTYLESLDDENSYGSEEKQPKNAPVYILFKQVYMYLARVNTANVRAKGNECGANRLLALQKEWGEVLHSYENGELVQKQHDQKLLSNLMTMRDKAMSEEKQRLTILIDVALANIGAPKIEELQKKLI